jgi:hypothetical protein
MKKLTFLIALVIMLIIGACTKDGLITDQTNAEDISLKHGHIPKVIKVSPVAGDNTQNLLDAFAQAKLAGPNTVVQLVEGTYEINNFMEIYDFIGIFKGAGQGKTFIKPIPKPFFKTAQWGADRGLPMLVTFVGGDIKMSDMTFTVDNVVLGESDFLWIGQDLYGYVAFVDWVRSYTPNPKFVSASVEDVQFIGGVDGLAGNGSEYNVDMAIWFGHDFVNSPTEVVLGARSNGTLTVCNCKFEKIMAAIDAAGMEKSKIVFTDNICINLDQALFLFDLLNTDAIISNNRFIGSRINDLLIWNLDYGAFGYYSNIVTPTKRTTYKITGNLFNPNSNVQSMFLRDTRRSMYPDENMPDRYLIHQNIINTSDGSIGVAGINLVDALIQENKFKGKGLEGVSLDGDAVAGIYAYDNKLIGNSFSGADYSIADIILGPNTKDCMVVGVSSDETVIDNGTGNTIKTAKHWKNLLHHGWYNFNEHYGNFPMHPNNK